MAILCRLMVFNSSVHKLARCTKIVFIPSGLKLNYVNKKCCHSSTSRAWKVLFFGNDTFSLQSLISLSETCVAKKLIRHLEVVTLSSKDDSVINKYARENNLKLHNYPCDVQENKFDIGVVTSFGRLIPEDIINAFPLGMINVHASLLPRWRGAAPIFHAIKNGDTKTGVSIVRIMPKKFDIGNVISQHDISLGGHELYPELHEKLAKLGGEVLANVIERLPNVLDQAVPQDETRVTAAPKLTSKMSYVNWNTMSSKNVYDLYRAMYGFYNLRSKFKDKVVQLMEIGTIDYVNVQCNIKKSPGLVIFDEKRDVIMISCKDFDWISVGRITLPGKKAMTARNFYNGFFKNRNISYHHFTTYNRLVISKTF